jgi:DNA-binding response OmpR family regulator
VIPSPRLARTKIFNACNMETSYNLFALNAKPYGAPLPPRVLIVEDDPPTQVLLGALLGREGIESDRVGDGDSALRAIERRSFDVILLDLLMPHVNGFEVLRTLARSRPALMKSIIVITAAADSTWGGCAEIQQVRCVLRKPLDIDDVVAEVLACLAGRETRPQTQRARLR